MFINRKDVLIRIAAVGLELSVLAGIGCKSEQTVVPTPITRPISSELDRLAARQAIMTAVASPSPDVNPTPINPNENFSGPAITGENPSPFPVPLPSPTLSENPLNNTLYAILDRRSLPATIPGPVKKPTATRRS